MAPRFQITAMMDVEKNGDSQNSYRVLECLLLGKAFYKHHVM